MPDGCRKMYPQNLHMQFHGREMHSLCFILEETQSGKNGKPSVFSGSSWIATGCEDGTVRLTRYIYRIRLKIGTHFSLSVWL